VRLSLRLATRAADRTMHRCTCDTGTCRSRAVSSSSYRAETAPIAVLTGWPPLKELVGTSAAMTRTSRDRTHRSLRRRCVEPPGIFDEGLEGATSGKSGTTGQGAGRGNPTRAPQRWWERSLSFFYPPRHGMRYALARGCGPSLTRDTGAPPKLPAQPEGLSNPEIS